MNKSDIASAALSAVLLVALTACGGGAAGLPTAGPGLSVPEQQSGQPLGAWPGTVPVDAPQPWEQLDSAGMIITSERAARAINGASEFIAGIERYLDSGTVTGNGDALALASAAGSLSNAIYRIPLGGAAAGLVSVDANLTDGDGYFVGLADYGSDAWDWHGPFTDSHVRLTTADGDYTSALGSVFVCVVAWNGAAVDVVGIGVNPLDSADVTPPPVPDAPSLTPASGGLLLEWLPVTAGDLAGYRIYYGAQAFTSNQSAGVQSLGSLEGLTSHLLTGLTGATFVRLSAVDISGNESAMSAMVSGSPLGGEPAPVLVSVTAPSGMLHEALSITASGATSYDFDTNGDGTYEITGQSAGTAGIDTSGTGIIRPRVRAYDSGGMMQACGGVSLIVSSNSRPVASGQATPASGQAPLLVAFSGSDSTDFDGSIVGGGWDFDGDGTFDVWDDTDIVHVTSANNSYITPNIFNAKLRVVDNEGAWDVDTVSVIVQAVDPVNLPPTADLQADVTSGDAPLAVSFNASGSSDSDGSIVSYQWDFDGDGLYDGFSDGSSVSHTYTTAGVFTAKVRVTDNAGAQDTATDDVTVSVPGNADPTASLTATPDSGAYPLTVTLDASASGDSDGSIVNYEWDFDGDGTWDSYSSSATAMHVYTTVGGFTAKVRVTDDLGAQDTATDTVNVSYFLNPVVVDPASGIYSSLLVVDGNPAISYCVNTNWDLMYVRAMDSSGTTWAAPVTIDTGATGSPSPAVVDGNPAIAYQDNANMDLLFVRATDSAGTTWAAPVAVVTAGDVGWDISLVVVDGNPAISYMDDSNAEVRYIRATDSVGATWAAPIAIDTSSSESSLAVVDGNPAISYKKSSTSDLHYVRATDSAGTTWGAPVAVDTIGDVGWATSLVVVNGNPAISYTDASNSYLKYVRATDSVGTTWAAPVAVDTTGDIGFSTSLSMVGGRPAISYSGDLISGDIKFVLAMDSNGAAWAAPAAIDSGTAPCLALVDDQPAISYWDISNNDLKYVMLY